MKYRKYPDGLNVVSHVMSIRILIVQIQIHTQLRDTHGIVDVRDCLETHFSSPTRATHDIGDVVGLCVWRERRVPSLDAERQPPEGTEGTLKRAEFQTFHGIYDFTECGFAGLLVPTYPRKRLKNMHSNEKDQSSCVSHVLIHCCRRILESISKVHLY